MSANTPAHTGVHTVWAGVGSRCPRPSVGHNHVPDVLLSRSDACLVLPRTSWCWFPGPALTAVPWMPARGWSHVPGERPPHPLKLGAPQPAPAPISVSPKHVGPCIKSPLSPTALSYSPHCGLSEPQPWCASPHYGIFQMKQFLCMSTERLIWTPSLGRKEPVGPKDAAPNLQVTGF